MRASKDKPRANLCNLFIFSSHVHATTPKRPLLYDNVNVAPFTCGSRTLWCTKVISETCTALITIYFYWHVTIKLAPAYELNTYCYGFELAKSLGQVQTLAPAAASQLLWHSSAPTKPFAWPVSDALSYIAFRLSKLRGAYLIVSLGWFSAFTKTNVWGRVTSYKLDGG